MSGLSRSSNLQLHDWWWRRWLFWCPLTRPQSWSPCLPSLITKSKGQTMSTTVHLPPIFNGAFFKTRIVSSLPPGHTFNNRIHDAMEVTYCASSNCRFATVGAAVHGTRSITVQVRDKAKKAPCPTKPTHLPREYRFRTYFSVTLALNCSTTKKTSGQFNVLPRNSWYKGLNPYSTILPARG